MEDAPDCNCGLCMSCIDAGKFNEDKLAAMDEIPSGLGHKCSNCGHVNDLPHLADLLKKDQARIAELEAKVKDWKQGAKYQEEYREAECARRNELLRDCEPIISSAFEAIRAGDKNFDSEWLQRVAANPLWKEILSNPKDHKDREEK